MGRGYESGVGLVERTDLD